MKRAWSFFSCVIGLTILQMGCGGSGGGGSNNPIPTPTITSVSVSCSPATVPEGQTSQCTATVQGTGNFDPTVTWQASLGTIASTGIDAATYTAPSGTAGTATITATSAQDATKSGQATISVSEPPPSAAFQAVGPVGANVAALAADPTSPGTVYAVNAWVGGAGQIWKSTDGARTWQNITENLIGQLPGNRTIGFNDVKVSSLSGSVYVASASAAVIYRSVNHGTAWSSITLPAQQSQNDVSDIALDPLNDNTLYALTGIGSVLFGSQDGGSAWSQLSTSCSSNVVADPAIEGKLYCLAGAGGQGPGSFLTSTNGGGTWSVTSQFQTSTMLRFAVAPSNPRQVYLISGLPDLTVAGLYSSSDGGATWTNTASPGTDYGSNIVVDPTNALNVFVTTTAGYSATGTPNGLISTTDGGNTWVASNPVPPPSGGGSLLAMLPGSPATLLGSWGTHLWSTQNTGTTWSEADQGVSALFGFQVAVDPESPQNVYLAASNGGGISKSANGGNTWSNTYSDSCTAVAVDPFDSNHVLAGCMDQPEFLVSSDGGLTWQGLPVTIGNFTLALVFTIVFDPNSSGTIYISGDWGGGGLGIMTSTDGGSSWSPINNGLPSTFVWSIAVDPSNSSLLLAGTSSGIYNSTDRGATWTLQASSPAYSVAFDPNRQGNAYACGNNAYKSTDAGNSWSQIAVTGANISAPLTLVVDPKSADTLFLIPSLGPVGWTPDGGNTWFWLSDGLGAPFLPIGGNGSLAAIAETSPEVLYIPSTAVSLISLVLQH